ncbi:MAG: plasmid pRiA4b ORF-3 family protein [archaeon]
MSRSKEVDFMGSVLQLKIGLDGAKPPIWRRFLVEDSISFHKLHEIIQIVMGWENYHLYMFNVSGTEIGEPDPDYEREIKDSKRVKLNKMITGEKQKFSYEYDFGDSWIHAVVVEKVMVNDDSRKLPVCIDGKMACPPEDCGGMWGYENLLEIRKDKNHPDYEDMIVNWLGEDFDSEEFDVEEVNEELRDM